MTRLFDPLPEGAPRLFATALGVDFCAALVDGVLARLSGAPPEALARVEILVANARMQRRIEALFAARGPRLLPRIRPVTAATDIAVAADLPPAAAPLRVRLELAQLVSALLARDSSLAPRAALYDLADSLAALLSEIAEEDMPPERLATLDMADHAAHWARATAFLDIALDFARARAAALPEARQAEIVARLADRWREAPPAHPILVAGSTGSRGTTFRLMQAVAHLPQGAVILPGLDRDMPHAVWQDLEAGRAQGGLTGEDHPQFRLARVAGALRIAPGDIPEWQGDAPGAPGPRRAARNKALSLALRPAPVTDQWRVEGPGLRDLAAGFAEVTLVEAPTPQVEATAIALRLRQAVEAGERAALVSPDRRLARQVAAALDRWHILPDDSAGTALDQSVGGRFLRLLASARIGEMTAEAMVAILSNPLCHSDEGRGPHLRFLRDLELGCLRGLVGAPRPALLTEWAEWTGEAAAGIWADWVCETLLRPAMPDAAERPFADHAEALLSWAGRLARGQAAEGSGALYSGAEGAELARLAADLREEGAAGGPMSARDFAALLDGVMADRAVRQSLRPHAQVLIWGTQEARVQGADLVILSGLNEGTWPAAPAPDPWLNRRMRAEVGLRLPDRNIGLAAHDFQQAMAARQVWITRARRDGETETVPSRWLNRLVNLLSGASAESKTVLEEMRGRGDDWIARAQTLMTPEPAALEPPAPRPAPAPPVAARPTRLSVTRVETLIRDPYAIYARQVLRLRPLDPLRRAPDAGLRGSALHRVFERFVDRTRAALPDEAAATALLHDIAAEVFAAEAPWQATRRLWQARLERVAPFFLRSEAARRAAAAPWLLEARGRWDVPGAPMTLTGTADRIDIGADGAARIYDYKSGKPPTEAEERAFNKQLWLEALMLEAGAFDGQDGPLPVAHMAYIGLGASPEIREIAPDPADMAEVLAGFRRLLARYGDPRTGYAARRAVAQVNWSLDYDHLARFGEWSDSDAPEVIAVGGGGDD